MDQSLQIEFCVTVVILQDMNHPDGKIHGANMGPIWDRQGPGGPHVGPMTFAIRAVL